MRPVYSEGQVSRLVRTILTLSGRCYLTEVAGTGPRNRGTAGYPDITALMRSPVHYTLMVETKGRKTGIDRSQWEFQARAALVGQPCLIVRSPGALLNGLRYMRLLPEPVQRMGAAFWDQWDLTEWPENVNYLPAMARTFWHERGAPLPLALPDDAVVAGRRRKAPPFPLGSDWR